MSTNTADQLKSLTAQVSALTRLTAVNPKWLLVDVYMDIASSKIGSSRKEFSCILKDCQSELERRGIKSPTGKGKWCKRTIDVMLSNEKYTGNVRLLDNGKHDAYIYQRKTIRRSYRRKHSKRCR
ncbi:recombinase family protein [Desulfosporosinus orientis]|uniref:recombinase family protein n=1 Tax=Desulfosporosinus orientis TaxID=1563 RepID=UPI001FA75ECD|nr:recombinase family protein [Desulfosporosinus orientis]